MNCDDPQNLFYDSITCKQERHEEEGWTPFSILVGIPATIIFLIIVWSILNGIYQSSATP